MVEVQNFCLSISLKFKISLLIYSPILQQVACCQSTYPEITFKDSDPKLAETHEKTDFVELQEAFDQA